MFSTQVVELSKNIHALSMNNKKAQKNASDKGTEGIAQETVLERYTMVMKNKPIANELYSNY